MRISKVSVISGILSETSGEMSYLCVSARMGLRERRKEHDNEQGNTEDDDGSRDLRRTLRNGYGGSQRQSSAQGQSTHGDESACTERTHGQGSRPGAADGEAPRITRKTPCAEARDRPPRSASAASGCTDLFGTGCSSACTVNAAAAATAPSMIISFFMCFRTFPADFRAFSRSQ
mgnify:CR=1 FL=1